MARMSPPRYRSTAPSASLATTRPSTAGSTLRSSRNGAGRSSATPNFDHFDTNHDGVIDRAEFEAFQKSQSMDGSVGSREARHRTVSSHQTHHPSPTSHSPPNAYTRAGVWKVDERLAWPYPEDETDATPRSAASSSARLMMATAKQGRDKSPATAVPRGGGFKGGLRWETVPYRAVTKEVASSLLTSSGVDGRRSPPRSRSTSPGRNLEPVLRQSLEAIGGLQAQVRCLSLTAQP